MPTSYSPITPLSVPDVYAHFNSSANGLTHSQASTLLMSVGKNSLETQSSNTRTILLRQLKSSFVYLLLAACGLSLLLGQFIDAFMVALFIAINVTLGFIQEYRSEKTLELLKKYTVPQVKVKREGQIITIPSHDLVPGDVIHLIAGDLLPADVRFVDVQDLVVNESTLTGESVSVKKLASPLKDSVTTIYAAENIGFSGTSIVSGSAVGVVIATGKHSALGSITQLAATTKRESTFEKGMATYSRFILRLVMITVTLIILANLALKGSDSLSELLVFSIALAVSVIPEALPVVITFSLSRGASRLAKSKVIVKRLSSIEDLGSIEVLCTDKTGTLTENQLTVDKVEGDEKTVMLAALAGLNSSDPFDLALRKHLTGMERTHLDTAQLLKEIPFDPHTRHLTSVVKYDKKTTLIVRGALESILPLCKVSQTNLDAVKAWAAAAEKNGFRTLAVAQKHLKPPLTKLDADMEKGVDFVGLISFVDPIKSSTIEAVKSAKALGVTIKILTGDSPEVARYVARHINLITEDEAVMTGDDFEALSPQDQTTTAHTIHVFARVTPEQKYKIIQLLQTKYEVGFLGEGINDAPALKIANVGLVVQSAADVSRENADIILLQKSLHVIIEGIKAGREIFTNTNKYLTATLSSNFGNFYAIAVASLLIPFLPMLPLQILLVNLLSDFPMIAIATDTVDPNMLGKPKRYEVRSVVLLAMLLGVISTVFDFIFFALFYQKGPAILQTNWFIGSILTELVFMFSIRTQLPFFKSIRPSFTITVLAIVAGLATIIIPYLSFGQSIFKFTPPSLPHLIIILGLVVTYFITTELAKLAYYKTATGLKTV